jgi:ketosteroid isomerase-like protein
MARDYAQEEGNKTLVKASFDRWKNGTGGPFELLASDVEWTIVGTSPLSKTCHSKQDFLDVVINPFNARMEKPLTPEVHGIYSDATRSSFYSMPRPPCAMASLITTLIHGICR